MHFEYLDVCDEGGLVGSVTSIAIFSLVCLVQIGNFNLVLLGCLLHLCCYVLLSVDTHLWHGYTHRIVIGPVLVQGGGLHGLLQFLV